LSKARIAEVTSVASRTVAHMRRAVRELLAQSEDSFGDPAVNPLDLTWQDFKRGQLIRSRAEQDVEAWVEKQAKDWARRLAKTFGAKLATNPTLAARTLELYSDKLPQHLHEEWCTADDDSDE
jgi:hypothetical protein